MLNIIFWFNKKIFFKKNSDRKNIVVFSLHKIGDTIFTFPAISILLEIFGNDLIIICPSDSEKLYRQKFEKINCYTAESDDFWFRRIAKHKVRKILKLLKPKIIFDITGTIQSLSLCIAQKAESIFGFNQEDFINFYTKAVVKRKNPHLMNVYLDAVFQYVDQSKYLIEHEFNVNIEREKKILVHPNAGWKAKEWNLNKYIKLVGELNRSFNSALIVKINSIPDDIKENLIKENIPIIETKNIDDLIREINDCSVLIGNDSGPVYIANLLGKPTFTVYGPTNPEFSKPFGKYHKFIIKSLICSPKENEQYCFTDAGRNGCPAYECMNLLTEEEVFTSINAFLNKLEFIK